MQRTTIQRTLAGLVAIAVLAGAAPAFAQGPRPSDWVPLSQRAGDVSRMIAEGVASGRLTNLSAKDLNDQFAGLLKLEEDYRKTGLSLNQREDLQARYDTLSIRIRVNAATGAPSYYPAGTPDQ